MTIKKLHRWIGLAIALYLGFQSLTGILLLYRFELQDLFGDYRQRSANTQQFVSVQSALHNIRSAYPTAVIERLDFPVSSSSKYIAHLASNWNMPVSQLSVDPLTGDVQPAKAIVTFFSTIVELHHELAIGKSGKYIVGTLGLLLFGLSLSGLWLWWPGLKGVRRSLRVVIKGGGIRAYFSLHRTVGVVVLVFVIVTSSTGLLMAFGEGLRPFFGVSLSPKPVASSTQADIEPSDSVDALLNIARNAVPNSGIRDLRFNDTPNEISRVLMYRDGDRDWRQGPYQQAWFDPASGELRGILDSRDLTAGQSLFLWLYPIHTTFGLGNFGKFLAVTGGLGILLLCVTGPILWWKRRRRPSRAI